MILTGDEITQQFGAGRIKITEFDSSNVTTNSYDLRLGRKLLRYTGEILDPRVDNPYEVFDIPDAGYDLEPGDFVLGETQEEFGSAHYVPKIHARSGTARLGLFVHITADLIDIGAFGKSTLQLYATLPVRLYPLMPIAQVTFWRPFGDIILYQGKYQGSTGPISSQTWRSTRLS